MSAGPHHQVPMTQAQINQQQEQQKAAIQNAKLRSARPTDKSLPDGIEEACVDDGDVATSYKKLRDLERRLDAVMTRKRLDIVDTVSRNAKVRGISLDSQEAVPVDGVWLIHVLGL